MIRAHPAPLRPLVAIAIAALALLCAGCGQKGPLKLPESAPAKPASPAP